MQLVLKVSHVTDLSKSTNTDILTVSEALVRYVNSGVTLGSVNLPEVNLRSLTLDEPNHARVIYIHHNVPGVLRKVNEILGDHNVDKQITDNKGDVAYLMADISDVTPTDLKEISDSLEGLSCKYTSPRYENHILTVSSSCSYQNLVLKALHIFALVVWNLGGKSVQQNRISGAHWVCEKVHQAMQ